MYSNTMHIVRDGTQTLFWQEVWCGHMTFKIYFDRFYALCTKKRWLFAFLWVETGGLFLEHIRGGVEIQ